MSYKRKTRTRKLVKSTSTRLRLSIFRSNNNLFAQIIDDAVGNTVASVSTLKNKSTINIKAAQEIGKSLAIAASEKSIKDVIFDRGKFQYKGIIKAFADSAREAGLNF
ncbi:50S ribosomal protein L18 [Candidatus Marinamargulisbacteria bacterium SCGC AAA071-K20]|nr:50S ribosomal protein L18 [Candidatus Marinamargulisbacteria bacterium SCGC AAA071-K20]